MGELEGIYAIWVREFTVYLREKERIISSLVNPLLWIFAFGAGIGSAVSSSTIPNYQLYIIPGIMVMTVLFTSVFYGMYVIWDRKLDFLKEVLVAPLSRPGVFVGKMLGGVTDSMIQAGVLFIVAFFMGIPLSPLALLTSIVVLFLVAVCMTSIGLAFGGFLSSIESFQLIVNFVVWPLFFFSGALYQLSELPWWLDLVTKLNPLTYGVDALRIVLLPGYVPTFALWVDIVMLAIFCLPAMALGMAAFSRMGKI